MATIVTATNDTPVICLSCSLRALISGHPTIPSTALLAARSEGWETRTYDQSGDLEWLCPECVRREKTISAFRRHEEELERHNNARQDIMDDFEHKKAEISERYLRRLRDEIDRHAVARSEIMKAIHRE